MFRVSLIIVVILLGTSVGCRSMPSTSVAEYRSGNRAVAETPVTTVEQPRSEVRSAAFVQEAEEIDETEAKSDPAELTPPRAR